MALIIKWNKRAKTKFDEILEYLELTFGEATAKSFARRAYQIIEHLSRFPELGSLEVSEKQIRGILITKHNRLFYRITDSEVIL